MKSTRPIFKTEMLIYQSKANLGPVHTTPFLAVSVFVASKLPLTLLRFRTKTKRKTSVFVRFHTDLPDNKNAAKNIRFCASTLLRFCEAHCWILERFHKPPFLCVHIDQKRFQKPPFLWISTFDSFFENLRFCGVFVRISVNTFTKTEVFLSVFVQKRSSVNGALDVKSFCGK